MPKKTVFTEKQPAYRYFSLNNGYADIFIYEFIEELTNEEDGSNSYVYKMNEFHVKQNEITEEMIKNNPYKYLNYKPITITLEDRINAIEEGLMELGEVISNG